MLGPRRRIAGACPNLHAWMIGDANDHSPERAVASWILRRVADRVLVRQLLADASIHARELGDFQREEGTRARFQRERFHRVLRLGKVATATRTRLLHLELRPQGD